MRANHRNCEAPRDVEEGDTDENRQRGTDVDAEDPGVGDGVAGHRLHEGAGDPEGCPGHKGDGGARQALGDHQRADVGARAGQASDDLPNPHDPSTEGD